MTTTNPALEIIRKKLDEALERERLEKEKKSNADKNN